MTEIQVNAGFGSAVALLTGATRDLLPSQEPNLIMWLRADAGITIGGTTPIVAAGTTPPTVTLSGVPNAAYRFVIDITLLGVLGVAVFKWSSDDGATFNSGVITAASVVLGSTGVTASFSAGTYAADNVYTASTAVSAWADQSGQGNNATQATQANQPALWNQNGRPSLQGLNAAVMMAVAPTLSGGGTLFAVYTPAQSAGGYVISGYAGNNANNAILSHNTGERWFYNGGTEIYTVNGTSPTGLHIATIAHTDSASLACFFDGTKTVTSVPVNIIRSPNFIFGPGTGASGLIGYISEILVYSAQLTDTQIRDINRDLGDKYGIGVP